MIPFRDIASAWLRTEKTRPASE